MLNYGVASIIEPFLASKWLGWKYMHFLNTWNWARPSGFSTTARCTADRIQDAALYFEVREIPWWISIVVRASAHSSVAIRPTSSDARFARTRILNKVSDASWSWSSCNKRLRSRKCVRYKSNVGRIISSLQVQQIPSNLHPRYNLGPIARKRLLAGTDNSLAVSPSASSGISETKNMLDQPEKMKDDYRMYSHIASNIVQIEEQNLLSCWPANHPENGSDFD